MVPSPTPPGARTALRRWAGVLAGAALAGAALALWGRAAAQGAPGAIAACAAAVGLGGWLIRDGWLRARLPRGGGAGVATVREGRIVYFGPLDGGAADLDGLAAIEVDAQGAWVLRGADGAVLRIPADAEGAADLPDAFAALPGFELARAARALQTAGVHSVVWRRAGPPAQPRLALPGGRA